MLKVGAVAPRFKCRALIKGEVFELDSRTVQDDRVLILLFVSPFDDDEAWDDFAQLAGARTRFERLESNIAMVGNRDEFEIQSSIDRIESVDSCDVSSIPILIDPDGRVAALYDMTLPDGSPLYGQCIIDSFGIVRQFSQSTAYTGIEVGELERCIEAILQPTAEWPC